MGNYKFRVSNIIPNVWFYKLKQMSNKKKSMRISTNLDQAPEESSASVITSTPLQVSSPRKSYHFSRHHHHNSKKRRPITKSSSSSSSSAVSAACSCSTATVHSVRSKSTSTTTSSSIENPQAPCLDRMLAWSTASCNCSSNSFVGADDDTVISGLHLPPIKAHHKKFSDLVREIGAAEEQQQEEDEEISNRKQKKSPVRRISTSSGSPRVRVRINSPRLSKRGESNGGRRKSVGRGHERERSSESMAVVKSSADPERDFRESMVEMIVENEIRGAKDLEELLACYLTLNSAEYHHIIIQVFKQIWFDLNGIL